LWRRDFTTGVVFSKRHAVSEDVSVWQASSKSAARGPSCAGPWAAPEFGGDSKVVRSCTRMLSPNQFWNGMPERLAEFRRQFRRIVEGRRMGHAV
jgi:hypothetical protein